MSQNEIDLDALHAAATAGELWLSQPYSGFAEVRIGEQFIFAVAASENPNAENDVPAVIAKANAYPALAAELRRLREENAQLSWAWNEVQDKSASKAADKARLIKAAVMCLDANAWLAARDARMKRVGAAEWLESKARECRSILMTRHDMNEEAAKLREEGK